MALTAAMTERRRTVAEAAASGVIQGVVHQIRCWKANSSFCLLSIIPDDFPHETLTIKGVFPPPAPGACYRFEGKLEQDPKWGTQFAAQTLVEVLPSEIRGIERYLAFGPFPHVGVVTAKAIMERWGVDALRMLDQADAATLLDEIHGITPARATRILEEWRAHRERSSLHTKLNSFGLTQWQIGKLIGQYGDKAATVLAEDPYQVIGEISRFGFLTVDSIAARCGIPRDDIRRCRAAIVYLLEEAENEGHCYLPLGSAVSKEGVLGIESQEIVKLSPERLEAGLASLTAGRGDDKVCLVQDENAAGGVCVYLRDLERAEYEAALDLRRLAEKPVGHLFSFGDNESTLAGLTLTDEQARAVEMAKKARLLVITGGPGTGKTTILRAILDVWKYRATSPDNRSGMSVELAAPTGKAVQRMAEATGQQARTIHRLLEWKPEATVDPDTGEELPRGFTRCLERPLMCDAVVIDEVSMVDLPLFAALLAAIDPHRTQLVLVGDVDQLPSVGPGQVLRDIIVSGVCPVVRLTQIMRQEEGSQITRAAHAINAGTFAPDQVDNDRGDLYWLPHNKDCQPDEVADDLMQIVAVDMPASGHDAVKDVQVLCPQKRGPVGTEALNRRLQATLNPPTTARPELVIGKRSKKKGKDDRGVEDRVLRCGDKVIQTRNNYKIGVFNGEIGFALDVDLQTHKILVDFGIDLSDPDQKKRREVWYGPEDLYDLYPAYALTVHKSQGSEFPVVVIPLHTTHYMMLRRRLLYTGVTRAQECCVLLGTERALLHAVKRNDDAKRFTRLAQLLRLGSTTPGLMP